MAALTPSVSRRALGLVLLAAGLVAALLLPSSHPSDSPLTRYWLDLQLRWAAPSAPPSGVLVFDIDDASLAALQPQLGPWPFRRDVYAPVIDALRQAGAKAIALDLLLIDAGEGDAALARSLAVPGAPVVLAAAGVGEPQRPSAGRSEVGWPQILLPQASLLAREGGLRTRIGVVSAPLDADGRLRTLWTQHRSPQGRWPSLPEALLEATTAAGGRPSVSALLAFPVDPAQEARTLPFSQLMNAVLQGQTEAAALRAVRDQVVLIGSSALLADRVMTPGGQWRGATVLAQAYASLRDGRWLSPVPGASLLLLGLLPSLWALVRGRTQPWLATGLALAGLGLLFALAWWFSQRLQWLDASPAAAALLTGLLGHLMLHQHATRQRAQADALERAVAAQGSAAKSRFLAHVSHEIRTPLHAILGAGELLQASELNATQRQHLHMQLGATRHLATLIDELLDLSAIELGRMDLHLQAVRLQDLLQGCVDLMQSVAEPKGLHCGLITPGPLPVWVLADRQRLAQVLLNLLGNAIKFTEQGRIDLHVRGLDDGQLSFTVADTGVGIAPSQQARIFEPFAQGEHGAGGTGLGLSISRELVRLMGGEITLYSVPGAGSRFSFSLRLPLVDPPIHPAPPPGVPARPGLRLLLAEDNEVNAVLFKAQVAPLQAHVEHADNGHLAVALAQSEPFDLIVLDIGLPGLDGHACARAIRAHERRQGLPRTPVISLSAHAQTEDARASLEAGCDEHLTKPIGQARLLAAIARWATQAEPAGARPATEPTDERTPSAAPVSPDLMRRRAHARLFLGRWDSNWRAQGGDRAAQRRLATDLQDCAEGLQEPELLTAARQLAQDPRHPSAQQAVGAAVADVLRRLKKAEQDPGDP